MNVRSASIATILLLLLYGWCENASCQNSPDRFLRWFANDPVDMVSQAGPEQLLRMASFGAGLSLITLNDASSSRSIQEIYGTSSFLKFTNEWGNWKIVAPISAGIFAGSLLGDNTKFQDAAFTSLQSLLLAKAAANAGKFIFARARPGNREGPYDINFVDTDYTSFPSGHTAAAFALVTPWVIYYPGPITYSLMAIPVGTGIARIAKGRHWLSDVTAGAALGFSLAYRLSKKHLDIQSERVNVIPQAGPESFSLRINFLF